MLRTVAMLAAMLLGCFGLAALAQSTSQPDKKSEAPKGKEDKKSDGPKGKDDKAKGKDTGKGPDAGKETPKPAIPLDKLMLPKDAIIVVVDSVLDGLAKFPNAKRVIVDADAWQAMKDQLKALEKQLKPDKTAPSVCKLTGRLEGDFVHFRAEFLFATEAPNAAVVLGLQGGHLLDGGELDGQPASIDHNKDDGFVALIEKESKRHQLIVNFRVKADLKKNTTERGFDLGLPGAVTTPISLEFPGSIKELRCNDVLEKPKSPGRWQFGLPDRKDKLSVIWKEPTASSASTPPASVDGHVTVLIDEKDVHITAELTLEDGQPRTEWRLLVPPQAEIEVTKSPTGLTWQLLKATDKVPYHTLVSSQATAERWTVAITTHAPRPNAGGRILVGPFHVLDIPQHKGSIAVKTKGDVSLGLRVAYHPFGATYQKSAEPEFRYVAPLVTEKTMKTPVAQKAPLELEWRFEKTALETQTDHKLRLRTVRDGWEIDVTTRLQAAGLFSAFNAVELKLPRAGPRGMAAIGTVTPALAFPGILPWPGLWKSVGMPHASMDEIEIVEESGIPLKVTAPDATGKVRIILERSPAPKKATLVVKSKVLIPGSLRHMRVDLPRPLGVQERGAQISIQADERTELLYGPEGVEEPVPQRDRFELVLDQAPPFFEFAWREFHRELIVEGTIDVTLYEHSAQVKQKLAIPRDAADAKNPQVALKAPRGVGEVTLLPGGEVIKPDARQNLWVRAAPGDAKFEVVLQYDVSLAGNTLNLTPVWPNSTSQKSVKVRVWSAAGTRVRLSEELAERGVWKERSIEKVEGVAAFPSLVLQAVGSTLPLTLKIDGGQTTAPAAFIADRALIQVQSDDASQHVRARYFVRKIHAAHVEIELPLPLSRFREPPSIRLGEHVLVFEKMDAGEKLVRVKLNPQLVPLPGVLEIRYQIPGDVAETASYWRTTLHAPTFHSTVVIGQMRWQWSTTRPVIAASLGRDVLTDVRWSWESWLPTPRSNDTSADGDGWLENKEPVGPAMPVTYSFAHVSMQPETVYHLPRQGWLIGCSGIFLIVTLGGYFSPLPRLAYLVLLLLLAVAVTALAFVCPAVMPGILFGLQPGVVLFLVFVGIHRLVQDQYRRQLVFLPGFVRAKPGSTMARTNAAKRPREASTVDAPESQAEDPGTKPSTASS